MTQKSEEEKRLNPERIKTLTKNITKDNGVRLGAGSIEFLTDLITNYIEMMSLASLDRAVRSKHYIDSDGVIQALKDLGFGDIISELPDLSEYSEDMHKE